MGNTWPGLILAAVIVAPRMACAQQSVGRPASQGYSAALYSSDEHNVTLFPLNGEASSIHLPFKLGHFAFSSDGKVLYAEGLGAPPDPSAARLYKIEFNPTRVSPVGGSAGLTPIHSMAVSRFQDKVIISGKYHLSLDGGCGIF